MELREGQNSNNTKLSDRNNPVFKDIIYQDRNTEIRMLWSVWTGVFSSCWLNCACKSKLRKQVSSWILETLRRKELKIQILEHLRLASLEIKPEAKEYISYILLENKTPD